jgi:adenosine deaminase
MIDDALISFLKQVPKIELHAHLNGCIRESTLLELAEERNVTLSPLHHDLQRKDENEDQYPPESTVVAAATSECIVKEQVVDINNNKVNKKQRSLQQCFEIFAEISKCVTDLNALKRITEEALEDFAHQNVAYLELRSTPKELYHDIKHEKKATKKDYVDTILQAMENFENGEKMKSAHSIMIPRFIISVNRGESNDNAMDNADLAIQYKNQNNKYVVGLDLSGNPLKVSDRKKSMIVIQCFLFLSSN